MLYTVTLNPTIDRSLSLDKNLVAGDLNRVSLISLRAGGKGINCAEAACGMGAKAAAYTVIGRENIEQFERSTESLASEIRAEMRSGVTRTCIKLYHPNGMVTECNEKGGKLTAAEMKALISRMISDMQSEGKPTFVLLSGSLPAGVDGGIYADMIALLSRLGVKVMLDCDGAALEKGIAASPYLVKPNLSELEGLLQRPLTSLADIENAASQLAKDHDTGVLVTIGGDGMIYADKDVCYRVQVPALRVSTTVGAGDTVLGVLAASLERGLSIEQALQLAAAAACAKVTAAPGVFPTKKDTLPYLAQITVTQLTEAAPPAPPCDENCEQADGETVISEK